MKSNNYNFPLMSSIAERFEERNKKFLSSKVEVQKTNTVELRKKSRLKIFQQKRIFQSDRFNETQFEALIQKYPQLQSPSLSIQDKYEMVLSLFKNSQSDEVELLLECVISFCKFEPVPQAFVSVDISRKLVEILKSKDLILISKALLVIINGTYLFDEFKYPLLRNGAVDVIIDFVIRNWEDSEIVSDCLWSLTHLVQNEKLECLQIISSGLGDLIIRKISLTLNITVSVLDFSLVLLSIIFKMLTQLENPLCDPFLTIVGKLLSRNEPKIISTCFSILSNICLARENIKKVIKPEILNRIYYALNNFEITFMYPVFRLCGNIIMGSQEETETIVNLGIINNCFQMLIGKSQNLTLEALWIMRNVASDRQSYKETIIDHSNFKFILETIENEMLNIKINALECLYMVMDMENYDKLLSNYKQIFPYLVESLKTQETRVLIQALAGIQIVFEASIKKFLSSEQNTKDEILDFLNELGGIDLIYKLNSHPSSKVYVKARNFILVHLNVPENDVIQHSDFQFS